MTPVGEGEERVMGGGGGVGGGEIAGVGVGISFGVTVLMESGLLRLGVTVKQDERVRGARGVGEGEIAGVGAGISVGVTVVDEMEDTVTPHPLNCVRTTYIIERKYYRIPFKEQDL